MRKLRILYPSPILLVGRLFWLTGMAFSLVLIYWAVEDVMQSGLHFENGLMYSFLALIFILGGYAAFHLWPLIFGELTLTADYVKWHALFMRSVKIPYSELRYVEIRRFDEEMWFLISTEPGRCISCCPPSRCRRSGLIKSAAVTD